MTDLMVPVLVGALRRVATRMANERDTLCALDGAIGDGDHGIAMEQGFGAVTAALDTIGGDATLTDVFNIAAKSFLNAVGASCGPLYATAFLQAGKWAAGRTEIPAQEVPSLFVALAEGIAQRGKASVGDKTMLDAFAPAAATGSGSTPEERLHAIAEAADAGADATRGMQARLGRAARLGERSIGHPDPGAVSAAMVIGTLCASFASSGESPV
jgi:dihydroxyacetone kinase-like protein